jgi:hypothetical protein
MTDPYLTVLDDLGKLEMAVVRWNMVAIRTQAWDSASGGRCCVNASR